MLFPYKDKMPTIAKTAKVFAGAHIVGDVTLGEHVGVWYNATIRGDMALVTIGDNTNIQEGTIVHTNIDLPTRIGKNVTVGHNAIIHAATVNDGALIGMGSIILDGAVIGEEALVAAGTVVPPNKHIPPRTLAMGNPMKIIKTLTEQDIEGIRKNTKYYVSLLKEY